MSSFKYYRNKKGLSQKAVGDYLGITGQAYSNYENDKRQADYETLLKLSELFETSIENMLADAVSPEVTFDDFSYALHDETKNLTEENKQKLLDMARIFRLAQQQEQK